MKINKIDKNFAQNKTKNNGNIFNVPSEVVNVFGVLFEKDKGFYRMSPEVAENTNEGVKYLNFHTSGGRICFSTNSKNITLHVKYNSLDKMSHMALTGQAGFALCKMENGEEKHCFTYRIDFSNEHNFSETAPINKCGKMTNYVLHMPLYNGVKSLQIEIDGDAKIIRFNPYKNVLPILYYGSSITQGGCASRSDHSYPGFISKWTKIDFVNLGFSGSCKAEESISNYISDLECSVFVYDYDHNAPNAIYLKETHEKLFLKFRAKHPNTPVIFISAPNFYYDISELKERRMIIKQTYLNALNNGDKNVYFIDGANIYPKKLRHECSVDGCHPTDLGFYYFASKIFEVLKKIVKYN